MWKVIVFVIVTILIVLISHKPLREPRSHGFYRTFAWEVIVLMILRNVEFWFRDPFSWYQIVSWVLLIGSIVMVMSGMTLLRKKGKPDKSRQDTSLVGLEKTTELVTSGIYGYIRHPLYSSLLLLAWGVFFKVPDLLGMGLVLSATVLLYVTGRIEEKENISFFGNAYSEYMQKTKMFIPFVF